MTETGSLLGLSRGHCQPGSWQLAATGGIEEHARGEGLGELEQGTVEELSLSIHSSSFQAPVRHVAGCSCQQCCL